MAACGHFSRSDRSQWKVGGLRTRSGTQTTEYRLLNYAMYVNLEPNTELNVDQSCNKSSFFIARMP